MLPQSTSDKAGHDSGFLLSWLIFKILCPPGDCLCLGSKGVIIMYLSTSTISLSVGFQPTTQCPPAHTLGVGWCDVGDLLRINCIELYMSPEGFKVKWPTRVRTRCTVSPDSVLASRIKFLLIASYLEQTSDQTSDGGSI